MEKQNFLSVHKKFIPIMIVLLISVTLTAIITARFYAEKMNEKDSILDYTIANTFLDLHHDIEKSRSAVFSLA